MSACYRASLPTTHPALTPLGFRNLLNFPLPGAPRAAPNTKWQGSLWEPVETSGRGSGVACLGASEHRPEAGAAIPCGAGSDSRPERQFRARVPPISGHSGNSVRDCRRSQARTAIPCETVADPKRKRQFRVGVATIAGQNWRQLHSFKPGSAQPSIGVFLGRGPQV